MSTAAQRYGDYCVERFMQYSDEEIAEMFREHEPLRKWLLEAFQDQVDKKICEHCGRPTHICDHGFVVHTFAPDGAGCYHSICGMEFYPLNVREADSVATNSDIDSKENSGQALDSARFS